MAMPVRGGGGDTGGAGYEQRFLSTWEAQDDIASIAGSALYITGAVPQQPAYAAAAKKKSSRMPVDTQADVAASRGRKRGAALKVCPSVCIRRLRGSE